MTREQARREIDSLDFYLQNNTDDYGEESHTAMMMAKDALSSSEKPNKWIPCSERLPNFAGVYLVTRYFPNNVMNPTYLVDACFFDGTDTWHNDNRINHDRKYLTNVVAWLEEPEPYKEIPTGQIVANGELYPGEFDDPLAEEGSDKE